MFEIVSELAKIAFMSFGMGLGAYLGCRAGAYQGDRG